MHGIVIVTVWYIILEEVVLEAIRNENFFCFFLLFSSIYFNIINEAGNEYLEKEWWWWNQCYFCDLFCLSFHLSLGLVCSKMTHAILFYILWMFVIVRWCNRKQSSDLKIFDRHLKTNTVQKSDAMVHYTFFLRVCNNYDFR